MTSRIVQISDNHLSARHGYARSNWEATVAHIGALGPELVISTGDLVIDDPDGDLMKEIEKEHVHVHKVHHDGGEGHDESEPHEHE